MSPTIIAVFAVAEEVVPLTIPGWDVISIVTGIGKTQAAMRLTKAILEHQPQCVINLGTAGTLVYYGHHRTEFRGRLGRQT